MNIKDLGLGDKFYCLTQSKNEYKIAEHTVAELGIDIYGDHVKFINNNQIESMPAKYCEIDFDKCAIEVEKVNQGYSVCSACGCVFESDKVKKLGRIKLCDKCINELKLTLEPKVEEVKQPVEETAKNIDETAKLKTKKLAKSANPLSKI